MLLAGAPLPLRIVFGIDDALRPAAIAECALRVEEKIAITARVAKYLRFTGDLQVVDV